MSFMKGFRALGILANMAVVIMYLIAMGMSHWASFNKGNGYAGLWEYCNLPKKSQNNETGSYDGSWNSWQTSSTSTTTEIADDDTKEDENDCDSFGLIHADSYLHIVRTLVIIGALCYAYGLLSGRNLKTEVEYHPSCLRKHSPEFLNIVGSIFGYLGQAVYQQKFHEDTIFGKYLEDRGDTGWCLEVIRIAAYMTYPTFLLLMSPTLHEKLCDRNRNRSHHSPSQGCGQRSPALQTLCTDFRSDPLGNCYRFITCHTPQEPSSEPYQEPREIHLSNFEVDAQSETSSIPETTGPDLSWMEEDGDFHHTNGIFTVNMSEPYTDPAPAYEDLALHPLPPSTFQDAPPPPPPSYDDVVMGRVLTQSEGPSAPPPPPPFEPPAFEEPSAPPSLDALHRTSVTTDSHPLPPPPYEEASTHISLSRSSSVSL